MLLNKQHTLYVDITDKIKILFQPILGNLLKTIITTYSIFYNKIY